MKEGPAACGWKSAIHHTIRRNPAGFVVNRRIALDQAGERFAKLR